METEDRRKSFADGLFDLIRNDDQKAFERLFSIYFPRLNDFANKVVRDDGISQDIVQEAFLKIWDKRAQIQSINIEAFLFRLVRNGCIDYIKYLKVINNRMDKIRISSKIEELYRIDFVGDEPYLLIEEELNAKIEITIQSLPVRCREVFLLSRMDGLKNKEIAEKLHISIKNVERHITRALHSFRDNFSRELPITIILLVMKNL